MGDQSECIRYDADHNMCPKNKSVTNGDVTELIRPHCTRIHVIHKLLSTHLPRYFPSVQHSYTVVVVGYSSSGPFLINARDMEKEEGKTESRSTSLSLFLYMLLLLVHTLLCRSD